MAESFTVLWTKAYCDWLRRNAAEGGPLVVLFGGPHQSAPSFRRFGVRAGDYLYPVRVHKTALYIIARMRVREIISIDEYLLHHLECPDIDPARHLYQVQDDLIRRHPELGHRIPWGCVSEAALGEEGTPIRFDVTVPPGLLEGLRYRSRSGERGLKYVEGGRLTRPVSIQGGVYRLSPESAGAFEHLVLGTLDLTPSSR